MSKEELSIEALIKKVKAGQRLTHEEIGFWLFDHEQRLRCLESKPKE